MTKRVITYDEVLSFLERLLYHKFKEVVEHYSVNNKSSFEKDLDIMVTLNFQQRLEKLVINKHCPKCISSIVVKCGKRASGIQIFQCKSCLTKFTLFTGTIFDIPHYVKPSNYQATIFKNGYETPDYSNEDLA